MRFTSIFVVLIMLLITTGPALIADTASASQSGTDTIPSGGAKIYEFEYSGTISLTYNVKVLSGPNVDVIVTDSTGMDQYYERKPVISYISSFSALNTREASFSNNIDGGHYYIIIDNSNLGYATPGGQSVTLSYSFDPQPATLPNPSPSPTPDPTPDRTTDPKTSPTSGNLDGEDIILVVAVVAIVMVCVIAVGFMIAGNNKAALPPQHNTLAPTVLVCHIARPRCGRGRSSARNAAIVCDARKRAFLAF